MSAKSGFAEWQALLWDSSLPYDVQPKGEGSFAASARTTQIGDHTLLSCICHQDFDVRITHNKSEIARSGDVVHLFVQSTCKASHLRYRRDEATVRPGDWLLFSPDDLHNWQVNCDMGEFHILTMHAISSATLLGNSFGRPQSPDHMLNRLVADYVRTLATGSLIADAKKGETITRNLLDLVTLAFRYDAGTLETCGTGLASGLMLAITRYLDAHYTQPGLSVSQVAGQFGVTPRYIHMLFERNHTTFSEQLYRRRLEHAHRLLIDPLQRRLSITDIAFNSGFNDLTHFGRRYREMYQQLPREARARTS